MTRKTTAKRKPKEQTQSASVLPRTRAEWVTLMLSAAVLSLVVGAVVVLWVSDSHKPAQFRIERGAIRHTAGVYYLPITIINEGDATGAQVKVAGSLPGEQEEMASTIFDFIPARARAQGVLLFKSDPNAAEVHVVSYQQP